MKRFILTLTVCVLFLPGKLPAQEELQIGALFTLSGWAQIPGTLEMHGAELAVSDINARGGVEGKQLRLVVEDASSDLKGAVTAFHKLNASIGPRILLGPNFAEFAEVVAPYAQGAGMIMITPSGFTKTLTRNRDRVFTLNEGFGPQIKPVIEYIITNGYKEMLIVRTIGSYFDGIAEAAVAQLEGHQIRVVQDIALNPKEADYRSIVSRIKSTKVPVVLALLQEGGDLSQFFRQSKEQRLEAQIFTYDVMFDSEIRDRMEIAEGAICYRYINNGSDDFTKRFTERFDTPPLYTSERAYDAVQLFAKAFEECDGNFSLLPDCIRRSRFEGQGGPVAFNAQNVLEHGGDATKLFQIKNARYEAISRKK